MKKIALLVMMCFAFSVGALAERSQASLILAKHRVQHRVRRHHAHRATKHHAPRRRPHRSA